jgi:hypothetical protein
MATPNIFIKKRNIDIVFCIDSTGSMMPCLDSVKTNARRFHSEFEKAMTEAGSEVSMMRVRVIVFRDYKKDGVNAMQESRFFELPDEADEYEKYLFGISAFGGSGQGSNGLEALYLAMKSDFSAQKDDRQVIVLFADTDATPIRSTTRIESPYYPSDAPDFNGLSEAWECVGCGQNAGWKLRERLKRMILFAPQGTAYETRVKKRFNRSVFEPVNTGAGLKDIDFTEIIKIIAASASNA